MYEWCKYSELGWCASWLPFWCSWLCWFCLSSLGKECRWMTRALLSIVREHGQSTVWQRHLLLERDWCGLKRQRSDFWAPIPTLQPDITFIQLIQLMLFDSLHRSIADWLIHLIYSLRQKQIYQASSRYKQTITLQMMGWLIGVEWIVTWMQFSSVSSYGSPKSFFGEMIGSRMLPPRLGRILRWLTQPMSASPGSSAGRNPMERPTDGE